MRGSLCDVLNGRRSSTKSMWHPGLWKICNWCSMTDLIQRPQSMPTWLPCSSGLLSLLNNMEMQGSPKDRAPDLMWAGAQISKKFSGRDKWKPPSTVLNKIMKMEYITHPSYWLGIICYLQEHHIAFRTSWSSSPSSCSSSSASHQHSQETPSTRYLLHVATKQGWASDARFTGLFKRIRSKVAVKHWIVIA